MKKADPENNPDGADKCMSDIPKMQGRVEHTLNLKNKTFHRGVPKENGDDSRSDQEREVRNTLPLMPYELMLSNMYVMP